MQVIAETGACFAVVDHDSSDEPLSGSLFQFSQATEVRGGHRCGGLDFDTDQRPGTTLDYDVHLRHVPVPGVVELQVGMVPTRLSAELLVDKRLQKMTESGAILS